LPETADISVDARALESLGLAVREKRKVKPKPTHHVLMELAIAALNARLPPGDR
jgi:hypothetical protein